MAQGGDGRIRIGVGGWRYDPWRETFYPKDLPKARELEHASRKLTSIEIDSTYYGGKTPEIFRRWRDADAGRLRVRGQGIALRHQPANSRRGRTVDGAVLPDRRDRTRRKARPDQLAVRQERSGSIPRISRAFLALLPKTFDGRRASPRGRGPQRELPHAGFRRAGAVAGVAVVVAGDAEFPLIADVTAPFVYARIMGTSEDEALGYPDGALDAWAGRAGPGPGAERPPICQNSFRAARPSRRPGRVSLCHFGFQGAEPGRGDRADRESLVSQVIAMDRQARARRGRR